MGIVGAVGWVGEVFVVGVLVEGVSGVSGEMVKVVVEGVLVAGGFVVLPRGNPIAFVGLTHG